MYMQKIPKKAHWRSRCCGDYKKCLWRSMQWSQVPIRVKDLSPDKESKSLSAVPWFIHHTQSRRGGERGLNVNTENKNWFYSHQCHTVVHWMRPPRDVTGWNQLPWWRSRFSGYLLPDHILASRCHSSLVPPVFMLPLSAGIGLQRSYWEWFHSIFKEKRVYPFDCYLLAPVF